MSDHPYLVRVDPELWKDAKAKAKREGLSLKQLWFRLLIAYVEQHDTRSEMTPAEVERLYAAPLPDEPLF